MSGRGVSNRGSGRVEDQNPFDLGRGQIGRPIRDDSVDPGRSLGPLTAARVAAVGERLTDLDLDVARTLQVVRLASGAQLARLHFPDGPSGQRSARRRLSLLVEFGVLARLERRIGGVRAGSAGFVYTLDLVGQRLVSTERPHRPWTLGLAFVAHLVAVTECYVQAQLLTRANCLDLLDFQAEPACWRTWRGPGGTSLTLKPDASLYVGVGDFEDRWMLEVDRATEDLPRIVRKAAQYARYYQAAREDPFPRVLWLTTTERRRDALAVALRQLPAEHHGLFQVAEAHDFARVLVAGPGTELVATTGGGAGGPS